MTSELEFQLRRKTPAEQIEWLNDRLLLEIAAGRRLSEELGIAAVELVRLRAEVLQVRHELRRSQVRESGLAGSLTAAADLGRVRVEVVREMCKGGAGDG